MPAGVAIFQLPLAPFSFSHRPVCNGLDRKIHPMPDAVIGDMQGRAVDSAVDAFLQSFDMCDQRRNRFTDRVGQVAVLRVRLLLGRGGYRFFF